PRAGHQGRGGGARAIRRAAVAAAGVLRAPPRVLRALSRRLAHAGGLRALARRVGARRGRLERLSRSARARDAEAAHAESPPPLRTARLRGVAPWTTPRVSSW